MTWHFLSTCLNWMCFSNFSKLNQRKQAKQQCRAMSLLSNQPRQNQQMGPSQWTKRTTTQKRHLSGGTWSFFTSPHPIFSSPLFCDCFSFQISQLPNSWHQLGISRRHPSTFFRHTHFWICRDDRPKHSMYDIFTCMNGSFLMVN